MSEVIFFEDLSLSGEFGLTVILLILNGRFFWQENAFVKLPAYQSLIDYFFMHRFQLSIVFVFLFGQPLELLLKLEYLFIQLLVLQDLFIELFLTLIFIG